MIVVARGGGSLADLFAFCDETLCRTVALLRVPVIASVGHHTDRTLIDDVAAVACSTPTHAAEAAVPLDCAAARAALPRTPSRLERQGRRAVVDRARALARLSRAPAHHVERHRARLHQLLRELRAATRRAVAEGERETSAHATALARRAAAPRRRRAPARARRPRDGPGSPRRRPARPPSAGVSSPRGAAPAGAGPRRARPRRAAALVVERARIPAAALARGASLEARRRELERPLATLTKAATVARRRRELDRLAATLAAHDPQRTLERGYALLEDPSGEPVTAAAAARAAPQLTVRLHDGRVAVRPERA